MDESRRRFLKGAGATALGLGCGMPILDAAQNILAADQGHDAPTTRQWAMVVDIAKCRDERVRRTCVTACHREHAVPNIPQSEDEVKWIWAEDFENTFPDEVHAGISEEVLETPVLVLCNHCSSPPCVRVCPTGATWKRDSDGIVMMDMHRCIGCRYCMAACPYGSRSFNWRDPRPFIEMGEDGQPLSDFPTRTKGVVEKCNFCAERLREGREPACVEAVSSIEGGQGALIFGDLSDASSEVRQVLRERYTIARRVGLGTGPNVFYIV